MAVKRSNGEVGGRSIEMAEKEFILRVRGYVQDLDDLRKVAVGVGPERRAHSAWRGGQRAARPRHAPRHRRAERRRRNRRRHRRRALRRQRAPGHPGREGAARPGDEEPAAGRELHHRLRPQRADRPRGQDARREAHRGKHRRGARLPAVPAAPAQRARGHHHPAHRRAGVVPDHVSARASARTSCRWAASPSPSARWWTRSSS